MIKNKYLQTSASFVTVTPDAEKTMAEIARVSNPSNQKNDAYEKLLKYCINHKHWSIFESSFLTVEVNTSLAIAAQILRHKSMYFQQFSARYSSSNELLDGHIPLFELREQDTKNRQNSTNTLDPNIISAFEQEIEQHFTQALDIYNRMLGLGVAKECARFILPTATPTRMYLTGNCRSWIHYLDLRGSNGTQKEHMDVVASCKPIFIKYFPAVSSALGWQ